MSNVKRLRRRRIYSCLLATAFSLVLTGKLSASVIRIDGGLEDWEGVKVCASDPKLSGNLLITVDFQFSDSSEN